MNLAVVKISVGEGMDCIASVHASIEDAVKAVDTVLGKYFDVNIGKKPVKAVVKTVLPDTIEYAINDYLGDYVCNNPYDDLREEFREDLDKLFKEHAWGIVDEIVISKIEIGVPFNNYSTD